jgi:hypothetical protein
VRELVGTAAGADVVARTSGSCVFDDECARAAIPVDDTLPE